MFHLHHWIAERTINPESQVGRPGPIPGIFLVLDPAIDGGTAVNELRLHNTALLSLVFIENLVNMGAANRDPILVPVCIAQRHLSPDLLTRDKWLVIMQF
jgi:hypothetical protein